MLARLFQDLLSASAPMFCFCVVFLLAALVCFSVLKARRMLSDDIDYAKRGALLGIRLLIALNRIAFAIGIACVVVAALTVIIDHL